MVDEIHGSPTFFLHAKGEYEELSYPRPCWTVARLTSSVRDDYMLVRIDPPLVGQRFGLGEEDLHYLVLASRLQGDTLFPVSCWPCPVYVMRLLADGPIAAGSLLDSQIELITIGLVFRTLDEAVEDVERRVF